MTSTTTNNESAGILTIITPAYNCKELLPALIASLRRQTDTNFEWVVVDGASSDGTVELLHEVTDICVVVSSQSDFGIYDALNRGIRLATGDYYVVAGADDVFADDAVERYRAAIREGGQDIIAACVKYGKYFFRTKSGPSWFFGEKSFIANHSVGTAFRKNLHNRFGFYSRKFPIAADSLFVLQACKGGATRRVYDYVVGEIGAGGVSDSDWAGSATELFRVQIIVGEPLFVQVMLLLLRVIKGASSGAKSLHDSIFRE
jgi:glycosyltransferase involved in cell wall biosynthesis